MTRPSKFKGCTALSSRGEKVSTTNTGRFEASNKIQMRFRSRAAVIKVESKRALVAEVKIIRDRGLTEAMTIARIQSMARVASAKSLVELKKAKKIGILEKRQLFLYDPAAHREQAALQGAGRSS
jgi:hypothetical protein